MTLRNSRYTLPAVALGATALAVGVGAIVLSDSATAAPSRARAAVSGQGWALSYTAAAGQKNELVVTVAESSDGATRTYLIDDRVTIEAGNGCDYPEADKTLVACTVAVVGQEEPGDWAVFKLGDKNDKVAFSNPGGIVHRTFFRLGDGNDKYASDVSGIDGSKVYGLNGNDTITTGKQIGTYPDIDGGAGNDSLRTWGDGNFVYGGTGNDRIRTTEGKQLIWGGGGNDVIRGGAQADRIVGGPGNDEVFGDQHSDQIWGNDGNDRLNGGSGKDKVWGGKGNDFLIGGGGPNELYGGPGDDKLAGGPQGDKLVGGPGKDDVNP